MTRHPSITIEVIEDAMQSDESMGFCIACGHDRQIDHDPAGQCGHCDCGWDHDEHGQWIDRYEAMEDDASYWHPGSPFFYGNC